MGGPLGLPVGIELSQPRVAPSFSLGLSWDNKPLGESLSRLGLCPSWDNLGTPHSPGSHGARVPSSSQDIPKSFRGLGLHLNPSKSISVIFLVALRVGYFALAYHAFVKLIVVDLTFFSLRLVLGLVTSGSISWIMVPREGPSGFTS